MRRDWSAEELSELWTLGPAELVLVGGLPDASKVGLAAQLAYWRVYGRFPDDEADLSPAAVGHLAAQLGIGADALEIYDWAGRTGRRHRRLIPDYLAVADFDELVEARFRRWLGTTVPANCRRRCWRAKSAVGSPASGSRDLAWRLDPSCAPPTTTRSCSASPTASMPCAGASGRTAHRQWRGHRLCGTRGQIPARIGHPVPRRRGRGWMSQGRCARGNLSRCRPGYAGGAGARGLYASERRRPVACILRCAPPTCSGKNHRTPGSQSSAIWAHAR